MHITQWNPPAPLRRGMESSPRGAADLPGIIAGVDLAGTQPAQAPGTSSHPVFAREGAMFIEPKQTYSIFETDEQMIAVLKFATKAVAAQLGAQYGVACDAIWISYDVGKITNDWRKPGANHAAGCFRIAGAVLDAFQLPGGINSNLKIPDGVVQSIGIAIKSGETYYQGRASLTDLPGLTAPRMEMLSNGVHGNIAAAFDPAQPNISAVPVT
jgi:hypothetical protein